MDRILSPLEDSFEDNILAYKISMCKLKQLGFIIFQLGLITAKIHFIYQQDCW